MKVTMLGTSAAYPSSEEACSGFLIQDSDTNILIDCGTGILLNLQKYIDLRDVSAIFISHMHADHFLDLIPYRYALHFGLETKNSREKIKLFLPPDGSTVLDDVVTPFAETDSFFNDVFDIYEYSIDNTTRLNNMILGFTPVQHFIPTYGITITGDNKKLGYSSDTGSCSGVYEVAKDADVFICHAGACLSNGKISEWGHMLPEKAGAIAKESGAKRLILSHLWPMCDRELTLSRAAETYGKPVILAKSCHTHEI